MCKRVAWFIQCIPSWYLKGRRLITCLMDLQSFCTESLKTCSVCYYINAFQMYLLLVLHTPPPCSFQQILGKQELSSIESTQHIKSEMSCTECEWKGSQSAWMTSLLHSIFSYMCMTTYNFKFWWNTDSCQWLFYILI